MPTFKFKQSQWYVAGFFPQILQSWDVSFRAAVSSFSGAIQWHRVGRKFLVLGICANLRAGTMMEKCGYHHSFLCSASCSRLWLSKQAAMSIQIYIYITLYMYVNVYIYNLQTHDMYRFLFVRKTEVMWLISSLNEPPLTQKSMHRFHTKPGLGSMSFTGGSTWKGSAVRTPPLVKPGAALIPTEPGASPASPRALWA